MNYCIEYTDSFHYFDEIEEIEIKFNRENDKLPSFLQKFKDKTIVINTSEIADFNEKDIDFFKTLYKEYPNFKLKIKFISDINYLIESKVPFFFNFYIGDWHTLYHLMESNPTDMYITNELGFDIIAASFVLHNKNIKVRVIPNLAQSGFEPEHSFYKFFIRPEDMKLYEPYVDICEFFVEEKHQLETYYEIYEKDKEWYGNLKQLFFNFNEDVDNQTILPSFSEIRLSCRQKCLKNQNCKYCSRIAALSKTLEEKNLSFIEDK